MARSDGISIRGARQHNLQSIDVEVPYGLLTVVTGVSGSGKSSLAFHTLYAEGQRRYVETFSAYARQFLERMDRPDVDAVEGILPALAIERATASRGARSTVATLAEIHDPARLLWARVADLVCQTCGTPVRPATPAAVLESLAARPVGSRWAIAFSVAVDRAGARGGTIADLLRAGFTRLWVDDRAEPLDAEATHWPEAGPAVVLVDRVVAGRTAAARLLDSIETAFRAGGSKLLLLPADGGEAERFHAGLVCGNCGTAHRTPTPALFSFNSPLGACPACSGFGRAVGIDADLVVPDPKLSLRRGAVKPFQTPAHRKWRARMLAWCSEEGIDVDVPWHRLPVAQQRALFEGDGEWPGVTGHFAGLKPKMYKVHVRVHVARYRGYPPCLDCRGARLGPEARAWRLFGHSLPEFLALPVTQARVLLEREGEPERLVGMAPERREVVRLLRRDLAARLQCLDDVGLGYLTLDRLARTLSGGELQRVHLTAAIGTNMTQALFVLDEPSVGLHPADTDRLIRQVRRLVEAGNTVVVVEHDALFLAAADRLIDLGPGAGEHGGRIVAVGTPHEVRFGGIGCTSAWLSGQRRLGPAPPPPASSRGRVGVRGATLHNLQGVDLEIALGSLVGLAGPSGSGKSSLAHDTLYFALARALGNPVGTPGPHDAVVGAELLSEVVLVDQTQGGATSRANPATYVGAWDPLRQLFAKQPLAIKRRYSAGTFSFNVSGGRCEACQGEGYEHIEMQFLSDLELRCAECEGTRFRAPVREVLWNGASVADVLAWSVEEACETLGAATEREAQRAQALLAPVRDVGLGYLRLGQRASTLSSGEWQRLRMAAHLGEREGGRPRLFIFDEPTTGLHMEDVSRLLDAMRRLAARKHGLLIVEHHPALLAALDRIVELGPGAGPDGGRIVADGTPAEVAAGDTATAPYLREALAPVARRSRRSAAPPARKPSTGLAAIEIRGARHHNLRDLDVDLPRDRFAVLSGPSGSGKSSLAFDIVFAEGQRRYVETLGTFARHQIGALARPDVDRVAGIPPTVAIEQRRSRGGRRSTVATVTEVGHHLRLLFARVGEARCPECRRPLATGDAGALTERLSRAPLGRGTQLVAPRIWGRKGFHRDVLLAAAKRGAEVAWIDGSFQALDPLPALYRWKEHDIAECIAELDPLPDEPTLRRLVDEALARGGGTLGVAQADGTVRWHGTERTCPEHGIGVPEMDPRLFSHNSARGWCTSCKGLGTEPSIAPDRLPVRPERTLAGGALPSLGIERSLQRAFVREAQAAFGIGGNKRWGSLDAATQKGLVAGSKKPAFRGAAERLAIWIRDAGDNAADIFGDLVRAVPCSVCEGTRLRPEARAVSLGGRTLVELLGLPLASLRSALGALVLDARGAEIARPVLAELRERIALLDELGLGYLGLDRDATTLSGGESQRLRIAAQLGSPLRGVLYVLDEPTIGLHATDNAKLIAALRGLSARGNGLLVVEHDLETILQADEIIDMGPGGGRHGGRIVARGTPAELAGREDSPTGRLIARPPPPLAGQDMRSRPQLTLRGANLHNVHDVDVDVPLGALVMVTGVSGAGKSTLVHGVLVPALRDALAGNRRAGATRLAGFESLERVVEVDASPIGSTPRSVPATYLGIWDALRRLLASTPEAIARGYKPGRFSFNTKDGRCVACEGRGEAVVEMSFLPDVRVPCERCRGARFETETLDVTWQGLSAGDLLRLTFDEAVERLADLPSIAPACRLMQEVGLGYLALGQPSPTLSGGEAQRMRLVAELQAGEKAGRTFYVLDEPTIGLHGEDVDRLLAVLRRLVERGGTVLVIEHHLEAIAQADHVIDMGPGAGAAGGRLVAVGSPAAVAAGRKPGPTGAALRALARARR